MEVVSTVESVRQVETRAGNIRYVVRDSDDNEYTTFREAIGDKAAQLEGQRTRIEPAPDAAEARPDTDPEEAAWRTAVDAAPWLLGESDPHQKTPPDKLYKTLRPFKEKIAGDIKHSDNENGSER